MSWKYFIKNHTLPAGLLHEVLRKPLITERTTLQASQNKVVFEIDSRFGKADVKAAVEKLFKVKVLAVNISHRQGKIKAFRGRLGQRNQQKKAIITLAAGQNIDVTAGL